MKIEEKNTKTKNKIKICLVALAIIVLLALMLTNKSNIKELIASNSAESEIRNLGVTNESETESWDSSIVSEIIVDTSMTDDDGDSITMYVPIPAGYTVSDVEGETTVKEGLVIYEGEETVSEDSDAKTTRNQYVWVPVNPSDVYWTDDDGNVYGIEYTFSETGRTANNVSREPVLPTSSSSSMKYYEDYYLESYESDIDSALELQADMQADFRKMTESIEKYGRILYWEI